MNSIDWNEKVNKSRLYEYKRFLPYGQHHVLFCSLAVLDPRVGHTMDVLSPFISVLCHSDWLFHGESCTRLDVVHPGRAWPSSPACTWHCSLYYLFLHLCFLMVWPHYPSFVALTVSNSSLFTPALFRTHSFVCFAVHETRSFVKTWLCTFCWDIITDFCNNT